MRRIDDEVLDENGVCVCSECTRWVSPINIDSSPAQVLFRSLEQYFRGRCVCSLHNTSRIVLHKIEPCMCDSGDATSFDFKFADCQIEYTAIVDSTNTCWGVKIVGRCTSFPKGGDRSDRSRAVC